MGLAFIYRCSVNYMRYRLYRISRFFGIRLYPYPFLAVINLTSRCNLKCDFCTAYKGNKTNKHVHMSMSDFRFILRELKKNNFCVITFSGGEPLLNKNVYKFAEMARKKGFFVNLSTNGVLAADQDVAKNIAGYFDAVRISLHATGKNLDKVTGGKNVYDSVVKGLDNLRKFSSKIQVGLNIVIFNQDKHELQKIIRDTENKVDFYAFLPEFSFYQSEEFSIKVKNYERMFNELYSNRNIIHNRNFLRKYSLKHSKKICDAGKLYLMFTPDGNIYACPFISQNDSNLLGNVNSREKLRKILSRNVFKDFSRHCTGCYSSCTTDVSEVFRSNPLFLLKDNINKFIMLLKK